MCLYIAAVYHVGRVCLYFCSAYMYSWKVDKFSQHFNFLHFHRCEWSSGLPVLFVFWALKLIFNVWILHHCVIIITISIYFRLFSIRQNEFFHWILSLSHSYDSIKPSHCIKRSVQRCFYFVYAVQFVVFILHPIHRHAIDTQSQQK